MNGTNWTSVRDAFGGAVRMAAEWVGVGLTYVLGPRRGMRAAIVLYHAARTATAIRRAPVRVKPVPAGRLP